MNSSENLIEDLRRRIPRRWRDQIKVEEIDRLATSNGRPAGTPYALISARSRLACTQAMLSLGPFVGNPPGEWEGGWSARGEEWTFVAYDPSASPTHPAIQEAIDQADSASSKS